MKNNNNNDFRSKSNKDKRIIFSLGALDQFNTVAEKFSTATKSASPKKPLAMSELIFKKGLKAEHASKDSDSLRFKTVRKEECASTSKDFVLGESKDFGILSEMLSKAPQPKTPIPTPIVKKGDLMTEMLSSSKGVKASSNYIPVKIGRPLVKEPVEEVKTDSEVAEKKETINSDGKTATLSHSLSAKASQMRRKKKEKKNRCHSLNKLATERIKPEEEHDSLKLLLKRASRFKVDDYLTFLHLREPNTIYFKKEGGKLFYRTTLLNDAKWLCNLDVKEVYINNEKHCINRWEDCLVELLKFVAMEYPKEINYLFEAGLLDNIMPWSNTGQKMNEILLSGKYSMSFHGIYNLCTWMQWLLYVLRINLDKIGIFYCDCIYNEILKKIKSLKNKNADGSCSYAKEYAELPRAKKDFSLIAKKNNDDIPSMDELRKSIAKGQESIAELQNKILKCRSKVNSGIMAVEMSRQKKKNKENRIGFPVDSSFIQKQSYIQRRYGEFGRTEEVFEEILASQSSKLSKNKMNKHNKIVFHDTAIQPRRYTVQDGVVVFLGGSDSGNAEHDKSAISRSQSDSEDTWKGFGYIAREHGRYGGISGEDYAD